MVRIKFSDGGSVIVSQETVLRGYINAPAKKDEEFYLENVYEGSMNGDEGIGGSRLATVIPSIGIMGFILSVDCFTVGSNQNTIYRTSSVVSIEGID